MYRERKFIYFAYLIVDILLIILSLFLPYYFRYNNAFSTRYLPYFKEYGLLFFLWSAALILLLQNHHLYPTDRSLSIPKEIYKVGKCVFFASLLAGLAVFLLQLNIISRLVFGASGVVLFLSLSLWRICKRVFVRSRIAKGYHNINVLIVGAGKIGSLLAEELKNNPYLGFRLVGFVDDNKTGKVLNYDILGKSEDLEGLIQRYFVDEIFITIPSERKKVSQIIALAEEKGKTVRIVADSYNFPFRQLRLNYLDFIPLLRYKEGGLHGAESILKRFFDVIVSATLLIILAPLFALIAFFIKLDSRGSIFYVSKRCGKKGKVFNFYKFRSMIENADKYKESLRHKSEVKGPVFKIKDDPRITAIGRILRCYSLDELPQLINVLKGDMSLVGPRPPTPDEVAKYDTWQMRRLEVKPGITCLWQVRGRSDLSFYKWVKWDLWYIDNWSFTLDIQILLWTILAVLKKKGAY